MGTRYESGEAISGQLATGYEGDIADDLSIPSCGIEDVDRAFYNLFKERLPLYYKTSKTEGEQRRIPVIFSTGERFAVAAKKEPIRDKKGALILPIIAITRTAMEQENTKGGGINDKQNEMVIRRKVSSEDSLFRSSRHGANTDNGGWYNQTGRLLRPDLNTGLYDTYVIPAPKYFTLRYEIIVWAQYAQQINSVIHAVMGSYMQPGSRNVRLDTDKGYWFVAYFDQAIGQDNNTSDFSESERILKATFSAEVPGYMILPEFTGSPAGVRKYRSAAFMQFETAQESEVETFVGPNIDSGKVDSYLLSEIETEDALPHPDMIGQNQEVVARSKAGDDSANAVKGPGIKKKSTVGQISYIELNTDPYTGKQRKIKARVIDDNPIKGEQVLLPDDFLR